MKIKERMIGDVAVLDLSGKLLGGPPGSEEIKEKIYKFIGQNIRKVVINLDEVTRMNSSGLGILISTLTSLKNRDGALRLAGVNETMEGVLIMTKLNSIFEIYDTAEGAAQSF